MLYLGYSSYDTIEGATGREAAQKARAILPDLIVMDLSMPDGTGAEAIVSLKSDPLTRDIPIIVLTALHEGRILDRALNAGAAEIPTSLLVLMA